MSASPYTRHRETLRLAESLSARYASQHVKEDRCSTSFVDRTRKADTFRKEGVAACGAREEKRTQSDSDQEVFGCGQNACAFSDTARDKVEWGFD